MVAPARAALAAAGKALVAPQMFTTTGKAAQTSVVKEIVLGLTLGLAAGSVFKMWHLDLMKQMDTYYATIAKRDGPTIREQRKKYMA